MTHNKNALTKKQLCAIIYTLNSGGTTTMCLGIFRRDSREDKLIKKRNAFAQQADTTPKGRVVFFGDSITEQYDLGYFFPNKGYINRGIGGNISAELLGRIFASVIALKPKQVVLLIGINDLGNSFHKPFAYDNIKAIIDILKKDIGASNIIVQSIYPINNSVRKRDTWQTIEQDIIVLNDKIQAYCTELNIKYLNIGECLMSEANTLNRAYTDDGLHLNKEGYEQVTKSLAPHLL